MHKLSMMSLIALVAVGGILASTLVIHPVAFASPAPSQNAAGTNLTNPGAAGSNSSLLTQPPASQTGGDDDGGGSFDN